RRIEIPEETLFDRKLYELALTQDQVNAVKVLENIVKKPRKRISVVLIANRGRGKSCAIGIALAGIIKELMKVKHRIRVGVTAPEPLNVQALMEMAMRSLDAVGLRYRVIKRRDMVIELHGDRFSIEYWKPMILARIDVDIAVVDEAAGIPVPLLHTIWKGHKRSIFASTIHGYEGAGRGFSVRFLKRLREDPNTELYMYEMEEPIRYGSDDPVEKWQFRVLLLDAEPDELTEEDLEYIKRKEFIYLRPEPEELFTLEKEKLLRSIFGIYVQAHYRNEPDDLGMMADAPHHSIRALMLPTGKVVASAQLAEEGPIPEDYIDPLLRGGKIPGNIIPDRLLKHHRLRDFAYGRGWRIVRIAVHPSVQGRGIGSYLLKKLEEEAQERGYEWIGSGFGATEELLRFWIKNGFIPLHISPDRNPVSAEYTVLVLKPLKEPWPKLIEVANREFRRKILESLHDTYRDLEDGVALLLLNTFFGDESCGDEGPGLTRIQVDRLLSYYLGYMTYESCSDIMELLAKHHFSQHPRCRAPLSEFQERLLIVRTLQGHSWERAADILGRRKLRLIDEMRRIALEFLKHYYGVEKKSADGYVGLATLREYLRRPEAVRFTGA
ncbi:MAG: tRNA(Met) cytidine acetyltransferase, partial [Thermoprotei archaeon]